MNILAVDIGTKTGWAISYNGMIESGVQDFSPKFGESKGMLFFKFRTWLQETLATGNINAVVYEDAYQKGKAARRIYDGMITRIMEVCDVNGVEYTFIGASALKKHITGKGNASKEMMIQEAKRRYPGIIISDDNEADALLILDWAVKERFKK